MTRMRLLRQAVACGVRDEMANFARKALEADNPCNCCFAGDTPVFRATAHRGFPYFLGPIRVRSPGGRLFSSPWILRGGLL